jgi:hypothetical protein
LISRKNSAYQPWSKTFFCIKTRVLSADANSVS